LETSLKRLNAETPFYLNSQLLEHHFDESSRADKMTVSLVIPTLDEANNIGYVLRRIAMLKIIDEIIIVDGHSKDNTIEIAKEIMPAIKVVYQKGRGKGDALRAGFAASGCDLVIAIDADGSMDPLEVPRFLEPLLKGADFVKGSRFLPGAGTADMPILRKFGNKVFVLMVNILYGTKYSDLCYGYMGFRKDTFEKINLLSDGFEIETEINIAAGKAKLNVVEVPSFELNRYFGEGKLNTFRDGWRILKTIIVGVFAH
jgi:glycosyltransferase involved in cell wall biosynthesis